MVNLPSTPPPFLNRVFSVCLPWAACASSGAAGDFAEHYLNLIVSQSATNSTWVDGSLVAATNYVAIGTSGYRGAQITVTNSGAHTVTSSQPVGVEAYGWGNYDAYAISAAWSNEHLLIYTKRE